MSYAEKYKPTKIKDINDRAQEAGSTSNGGVDKDGLKRLTIRENGDYIIRMLPPHPGGISLEPKKVYWLPQMVVKKDDNGNFTKDSNGEYVRVIGKRPYFCAKVHGDSQFDLVDTYIKLVNKKADELYPNKSDEDDKKKYLTPINGSFGGGKSQPGILPTNSFLFYGVDVKNDELTNTICEYEIRTSVKKGIERIAASEASGDVIGTDGVFTDVEDGLPVKITVDSVAGGKDPKDWYSVSRYSVMAKENVNGQMKTVVKMFPIADDIFEAYDKVAPLTEYRTRFNHFTLKYQAIGLELLDNEHGYGIIQEAEFQEVFNYLDKKFPKPEEGEESNGDEQDVNSKSESNDEFDLMDMKELKSYIKDNKLGIVILPRYSEQDVREMIRAVEEDSDDDLDVENGEDEVIADVEEVTPNNESVVSDSVKARLDKIKANMNK